MDFDVATVRIRVIIIFVVNERARERTKDRNLYTRVSFIVAVPLQYKRRNDAIRLRAAVSRQNYNIRVHFIDRRGDLSRYYAFVNLIRAR